MDPLRRRGRRRRFPRGSHSPATTATSQDAAPEDEEGLGIGGDLVIHPSDDAVGEFDPGLAFSLYHLHRATADPKYRTVGAQLLTSLAESRLPETASNCGFASYADVRDTLRRLDRMPSHLSQTLQAHKRLLHIPLLAVCVQ